MSTLHLKKCKPVFAPAFRIENRPAPRTSSPTKHRHVSFSKPAGSYRLRCASLCQKSSSQLRLNVPVIKNSDSTFFRGTSNHVRLHAQPLHPTPSRPSSSRLLARSSQQDDGREQNDAIQINGKLLPDLTVSNNGALPNIPSSEAVKKPRRESSSRASSNGSSGSSTGIRKRKRGGSQAWKIAGWIALGIASAAAIITGRRRAALYVNKKLLPPVAAAVSSALQREVQLGAVQSVTPWSVALGPVSVGPSKDEFSCGEASRVEVKVRGSEGGTE